MNPKLLKTIQETVEDFEKAQEVPKILILGATGVGKSSLVNTIFKKKLQKVNTIKSTTRSFDSHIYSSKNVKINITDSPGYGEVGYDSEYRKDLIEEAKSSHVILLVLKADEKGYQRDIEVVRSTLQDPRFHIEKPLIIVLNQIDKLKPLREWEPPYNLNQPVLDNDSIKVINMKEKISLVKKQFASSSIDDQVTVVPSMADPEEGTTFGIDQVRLNIMNALPKAARYRFVLISNLAESKLKEVVERLDKEAKDVITSSAVAAAGVVMVNPIPASDIFVLAPIQIKMIIMLGNIYGKQIDKSSAIEVISALGAGFAARTIFQGITSFIPGFKNVIGSAYAAAATHGMGIVAKEYFKNGQLPSTNDIKEYIEEYTEHQLSEAKDFQ